MLSENSLTKEERKQMFDVYREWFDEKGFLVHWDKLEFILHHWKVDATILTKSGKETHTFFMTPSKMTVWVGFGKEHKEVVAIVNGYKPNRFEEMRNEVEKNKI